MELSRCSYLILGILKANEMTNKVRGFTIDEIMTREGTSKRTTIHKKGVLSQGGNPRALTSKRTTIHKKVKELQKYGYVDEAAKAARAKTYYITETGISLLPKKRLVEDLKNE
mgnify:CR=1 FL=1